MMRIKFITITLVFYTTLTFTQKKTYSTVSGEGKSNNGFYTYRANVEFQAKPEGLLVDVIVSRKVTSYEVTSYTYKDIDAREVGYTFPIKINRFSKKAFLDLQFYRGNLSYTAKNLQPNGTTYLTDTQLKSLFNTFNIDPKKKDCITCDAIKEVKNLNIKALNVRLEDLGYRDVFSEINIKIDKLIAENKKKEKKQQEIKDLKNQINSLGNTKEDLQEKKSLYKKLNNLDNENSYTKEIQEVENKLSSLNKKNITEKIDKEATEKESNAKKTEEEKLKEKQENEEREKKLKEEQERKRQEKINAYNERIESQRRANNALATTAATSSFSLLYLLGGVIYNRMGLPAKDLYTGNNFHVNFDLGYGFSAFPIAYSSTVRRIDYNGNETITKSNDARTAITVDLRMSLKFGYEVENGGGNIYGRFEPGFSPLFEGFNTSYGYGLEVFGGHKNYKIYGRYESGSRNYSLKNWIDPEEIGEGGKSSTKYQQIRAGFKFSYYRNSKTAKRDHLIIGIMEDYFDENSASIFGIRQDADKPILNLLNTPSDRELNPYIATGYFFEWKRDHTHRLYVEVFPNYPITGELGGSVNKGKIFIQAGFSRSIEGFFSKR